MNVLHVSKSTDKKSAFFKNHKIFCGEGGFIFINRNSCRVTGKGIEEDDATPQFSRGTSTLL